MLKTAQAVFRALEDGESLSDEEFDRVYPDDLQMVSKTHWTPVEIAKRAANLLVVDSTTRVLDIGSGAGKLCFVGALTTQGQFYGIEQRTRLVEFTRNLAEDCGMKRIQFLAGDVREIDFSSFQSFYLYNPFVEHIYDPEVRIDEAVDFNEETYLKLVRWVQVELHRLPVGTRVVTYHGFGGQMPPGYRLFVEEPGGGDLLRLWVKVAPE